MKGILPPLIIPFYATFNSNEPKYNLHSNFTSILPFKGKDDVLFASLLDAWITNSPFLKTEEELKFNTFLIFIDNYYDRDALK